MARKRIIRYLGLALVGSGILCALAGCGGDEEAAPAPPPNVLVVLVDALCADHLSGWGYERETSPFLDGQYTVFGQVTSGVEAVDKIVALERDGRDNPTERVEMKVRVE